MYKLLPELRISYDPEVDAMYIKQDIIVDIGKDGKVIGI